MLNYDLIKKNTNTNDIGKYINHIDRHHVKQMSSPLKHIRVLVIGHQESDG